MPDQPYLGSLFVLPYNFAPRGYAFCNGQLLPIAQNTALFALLGTTYGGNGQTTFALPDLRGRVSLHMGQGAGLTVPYSLGEVDGTESVTLIGTQLPQHTHSLTASGRQGDSTVPDGRLLAASADPRYAGSSDGTRLRSDSLALSGGNQPHENRSPVLTLSWVIATEGVFPSPS